MTAATLHDQRGLHINRMPWTATTRSARSLKEHFRCKALSRDADGDFFLIGLSSIGSPRVRLFAFARRTAEEPQ